MTQVACDCGQKLIFEGDWSTPKAVLEGFVLFSDPVSMEDWRPLLEVQKGGWREAIGVVTGEGGYRV